MVIIPRVKAILLFAPSQRELLLITVFIHQEANKKLKNLSNI
jgi:hypothetical protein